MNLLDVRLLLVLFIFSSSPILLPAQSGMFTNTPGEVSFTVQTVTDNGNFAPKHVLAIWIEDEFGFVKTRKLRANQRKQYLYTWRSVSNDNVVDAVTGATLTSHQIHSVTWDCTDVDGNVVPDGDYTIYIEFTEKHAQGPLTGITFTKGTDEVHLTPSDEDNFIDMALDYLPVINTITDFGNNNIRIFPNPVSDILTVHLGSDEAFEIRIMNNIGTVLIIEDFQKNKQPITFDLATFSSGIYFVEFRQEKYSKTFKIIKH